MFRKRDPVISSIPVFVQRTVLSMIVDSHSWDGDSLCSKAQEQQTERGREQTERGRGKLANSLVCEISFLQNLALCNHVASTQKGISRTNQLTTLMCASVCFRHKMLNSLLSEFKIPITGLLSI